MSVILLLKAVLPLPKQLEIRKIIREIPMTGRFSQFVKIPKWSHNFYWWIKTETWHITLTQECESVYIYIWRTRLAKLLQHGPLLALPLNAELSPGCRCFSIPTICGDLSVRAILVMHIRIWLPKWHNTQVAIMKYVANPILPPPGILMSLFV